MKKKSRKLGLNIDVYETLMPPFPNMTFDLDLWPNDLKISRDHLLIKDYLPTKFEASRAKPSWVISCTRLRATDIPTYRPTYRPTGATQYAPPFSKGGIKSVLKGETTGKRPLHRSVCIKNTFMTSLIISENVAKMNVVLRVQHPTA